MNEKINAAFSNCTCNHCLEQTSNKNIYIVDTVNSKCEMIAETEKNSAHFHVINSNGKNISFLAIDKCIFTDNSHKKCDFAVFDNQTFCFVEIKDTSNRTTTHKKKSLEQLKTTITKFKSLIDFTNYDLEAIISWRHRPLRPAASTLMQSSKLDFSTTLETKLLEGNQKEFN